MPHITRLPDEILSSIAHYLHRREIAAATQTCRQLQQAFTSQLWNTFSLNTSFSPQGKDKNNLSIGTITSHAHCVRNLEYMGALPSEYYQITFPSLVGLRVNFRSSAAEAAHEYNGNKPVPAQQDRDCITLIRLNPTTRDLHVDSGNLETSRTFWETVFLTLKNPRRLVFDRFEVFRGEALDAFWRAATRFEELSCSGHGMGESAVLTTLSFSRLERLALEMRAHISKMSSSEGNLEWFSKCPNLTRLHWHSLHSEFPTRAFAEHLEQQTWPRLTDLAMTGYIGSDALLSSVIRQLPPLEYFRLESAQFGPHGFPFLRERLFDTIRTLDLERSYGLASRMVLEILTGFRHLEVFKAFFISVSDLRANPETWVCSGLKLLEVFFAVDPTKPSDGELVFQQLSRLTRLEHLDLNARHSWTLSWENFSHLKGQGSLQWRVDSGLQYLSTLRRLRMLVIDNSFHDARMEDVRWMLAHWPVLQTLTCSLSQDPVTRKQFVELFQQHRVSLKLEDGWRSRL
ncbi:MAG: hypothetical protein J3R72DRAFT_438438 [Linnemannia gamsii]|nr:MAG: hypothetical protein J3R72DRAFT_438438 [Linnemannia gamsii]